MIEVKNLTKKYGSHLAVDNISFEVKDGEVLGLLGPNGAGKSTTMNIITGYIDASEGEVIVNGFNISKNSKEARKCIGYMSENVPLYYDLTVKEFVTYMAELKLVKKGVRKDEVLRVLAETNLLDVQNKLIKNLSRGYRQRTSMAGALVGDPEVIIMDEPTVGLDPKQIIEIRSLIKKLGQNHTVILSTHILSEVSQICEKVIIINKGKIVATDTPQSLEEKNKQVNSLLLTVEDLNDNMKKIKKLIPEIEKLEMVKDNNDGTKQYIINSKIEFDLRKKIFEEFPKNEITIFELKNNQSTLEDIFINLVDTNKEEE